MEDYEIDDLISEVSLDSLFSRVVLKVRAQQQAIEILYESEKERHEETKERMKAYERRALDAERELRIKKGFYEILENKLEDEKYKTQQAHEKYELWSSMASEIEDGLIKDVDEANEEIEKLQEQLRQRTEEVELYKNMYING
ncbi:hypothetical protein [Vibrio owensii]|uniref:hypothetical protein n=1 Tax=Vibrio owensii TaxID=696485 RepID=UPI0022209C0D|nr:hypothetical protein [Vibrio owensii]